MAQGQAESVFISYRRDDAAGYAGRLEEALERRLGRGSVFRDVHDIAPGDDFVQTIRRRLSGAQCVLVLLGPRWAGAEPDGRRRIDDERDFVRLEVQVALESSARVVPLLLPETTMPGKDQLSPPLAPLAERNALPLMSTGAMPGSSPARSRSSASHDRWRSCASKAATFTSRRAARSR